MACVERSVARDRNQLIVWGLNMAKVCSNSTNLFRREVGGKADIVSIQKILFHL
jgi:hypothetical protein